MRNLPCPHTTSLLAVSATLSPRWNAFRRGTLSPELRTRSLPIAHVRVGNYWSYSRSQLQHPILRTLNVTRQERALPSTTVPIYVRQTATRVAPTSRLYRTEPMTLEKSLARRTHSTAQRASATIAWVVHHPKLPNARLIEISKVPAWSVDRMVQLKNRSTRAAHRR